VAQDTCRAYADSALFDACRSLATTMADADYFDDVLLLEVGTHEDNGVLADVRLTTEEVRALCKETGTDAVVSFDVLVFNMKREIEAVSEGYYTGNIRVDIKGVVRSYLSNRISPITTVQIVDSLFWSEWGYTVEHLNTLLPTTDEALRVAAQYIGAKIHTAFVPHWNTETRWYFTGMGARWKEASVYAASEKWEGASERWQYIYEKASGWKDKAKSASNLALINEISGNLEKALELATISYQLFEENKGENNPYTMIQKQFMQVLEKRIQDDKKLNLQFEEE
jgi:hypothetical protein